MPDRDIGESELSGRNVDRLLGEMIAEIRGAKHATNNLAMKVDAIGPIAATANEALKMATEAKEELALHNTRLAVLEAAGHRRDGAVGLVEWISKYMPFAVLAAIVAVIAAWANDKL